MDIIKAELRENNLGNRRRRAVENKTDVKGMPWAEVRSELMMAGYVPLCIIGQAEHWVRLGRRIVLHVQTDVPLCDAAIGNGKVERMLYAALIREDEITRVEWHDYLQ